MPIIQCPSLALQACRKRLPRHRLHSRRRSMWRCRTKLVTISTKASLVQIRTWPADLAASRGPRRKAAGCDQWPAAEGSWRRFLSRQAWGPRSTEVLSTGWAGRGVTEASPSQWWALRLFRIWSARRMARRASSPPTRGASRREGLARSLRSRVPVARGRRSGPGPLAAPCRKGALSPPWAG